MAESPNKPGAPEGSMNALVTGSKIKRRLVVGELPAKMIAVTREGTAYRRELEAEVMATKGEITFTDAHLVDTAAAATIRAGICRWLLRHNVQKMSPSEILACTSNVTAAKKDRDAAVKALQLDKVQEFVWVQDPKQDR